MEWPAGGFPNNSITNTAFNRQTLFTLRISYSSLLATGIYLYTSQYQYPIAPLPCSRRCLTAAGREKGTTVAQGLSFHFNAAIPHLLSPCIVRPFFETCQLGDRNTPE